MKLIVKFNLVLFLVFAIGFAAVGFFANRLLQRNAKAEIVENARIMMEAALAVRAYTTTQIKPLLETQIKYTFLPQIVPAYSANQYLDNCTRSFPNTRIRKRLSTPPIPWTAPPIGKPISSTLSARLLTSQSRSASATRRPEKRCIW